MDDIINAPNPLTNFNQTTQCSTKADESNSHSETVQIVIQVVKTHAARAPLPLWLLLLWRVRRRIRDPVAQCTMVVGFAGILAIFQIECLPRI